MNEVFRVAGKKDAVLSCLFLLACISLCADEAFGFQDVGSGTVNGSGVKVGGMIKAGGTRFFNELDSVDSASEIKAGNIFSGQLDFTATGSNAEVVIELALDPDADGASVIGFNEAYVRAYFGKLDVEAGLRKLTWGKADSQGPLDVVNPLDLSDLTVTDSMDRKIARPMIHASYSAGSFTRIEAVFVPSFVGHTIDLTGSWAPAQISKLAANGITTYSIPDTSAFEYAQAGLRITTTIGSSDIGFQYFYGNLPKPAVLLVSSTSARQVYNRYQQIGADYASVLGTLNVRSEVGLNSTDDFDGTDGSVYNPSFVWSAGFDRDTFASINLNLQAAGSLRLQNYKIGTAGSDCEGGTDATSTKITVQLSRKFMKDELELKVTGLYGIEDVDCLVMPSVVWTKGDIEIELAAGIFVGNEDGELGQYGDNDYAKMFLTYVF